jgi:hypothetical protein
MRHSPGLKDVLVEYRAAAAGTGTLDPRKNNECARTIQKCYKKLRDTAAGRAGIIGLMADEDPYVRCWAAAHSLQWVPKEARGVLEALREAAGPGSLDAEWTLIEHDKGRLSFDF